MFEQLKDELPWEKRINKKYNTEEPRLSCWIGEHPYIYSGVEWKAFPVINFYLLNKLIIEFLTNFMN